MLKGACRVFINKHWVNQWKGLIVKYKKIKDLHYDFSYYVSKEGLFGVAFFGHKGNKRKVKYIYNALLKQYKGVNNDVL